MPPVLVLVSVPPVIEVLLFTVPPFASIVPPALAIPVLSCNVPPLVAFSVAVLVTPPLPFRGSVWAEALASTVAWLTKVSPPLPMVPAPSIVLPVLVSVKLPPDCWMKVRRHRWRRSSAACRCRTTWRCR